jgi:Flp pilus assembly protein TadD
MFVWQPCLTVLHPNNSKDLQAEGDMAIYWKRVLFIVALGTWLAPSALAGDLKITVPKRSHLTPVQQLNREGVEAVRKNQPNKAKELFYQAYVLDPGDPFTLNNLGYIAELEGQTERAQTFYSLAGGEPTEALVDRASSSKLEGESLQTAISAVHDIPMQINRANVTAVRLLSKDRPWEADPLLQRTLALDPNNGFTLNNMGVTKEAEGDYGQALQYYSAAANSHTDEAVVVTMNAAWRGKSVSEMAAANAKRLRFRMNNLQSAEAKAALYNLRGVSAMNRNDWRGAWENFSQAYNFDPNNAFSLNNQGYLAELNGDLETAQEFYREAQRADGSGAQVGLATRSDAEGVRLYSVANESEADVSTAIEAANQARRRNHRPIQLKRRDGTAVTEPATPQPSSPPPQPY